MTIDSFLRGKDYDELIESLSKKTELTLEEESILGICSFRQGDYDTAGRLLLSAHLKGCKDASVEYGNFLRSKGQLENAKLHFESVVPQLENEILWRCMRWLGVTEFQLGNVEKAIGITEAALSGFLKLKDDFGVVRVKITLARMYLEVGRIADASLTYKEVVDRLGDENTAQKVSAVHGWLDLILTHGSIREARAAFREAIRMVEIVDDSRDKALLLSVIAFYYRQNSEIRKFGETLDRIAKIERVFAEKEFATWLYVSFAEYHAELENFAEAHRYMGKLANAQGRFEDPAAKVAIGRLAIVEGNFPKAVRELGQAVEMLESGHKLAALVQARLAYAYALMRLGDRAYLDVLEAAVVAMRRNQLEALLRFDVKRYRDMLFAAALEPQLAAQVEGLIQELDSGLLPERAQPEEVVRLEIQTMRQLQARLVGERVHLSPGAVALLAYLSMQPGQTRPEVQLALLSERSPTAANSAFKSYLAEIRKGMGADAVRVEGDYRARRYSLHPRFAVRLDIQELFKAVQEGDLARAFSAARGEFMPGLEHSDWAELQRERARSALLALARQHIGQHRETAPERAILICNEYLKTDPEELEIHRLRVQLAAQVNNPVLFAEASAAYTQLSGESAEELLRGEG